jgi:hypothetical protein
MKSCFENDCPSSDGSENPFEKNNFFLVLAERPTDPDSYRDSRDLEKKQFLKKIVTNSWIKFPKNSLFCWAGKIEGYF